MVSIGACLGRVFEPNLHRSHGWQPGALVWRVGLLLLQLAVCHEIFKIAVAVAFASARSWRCATWQSPPCALSPACLLAGLINTFIVF